MSPQPGVYYGPDEDDATKDLERFFLAGDFICGVGYGQSAKSGDVTDRDESTLT